MRISFHGSIAEYLGSGVVTITQILHGDADAFCSVIFFKGNDLVIMAVILLRHFHNIHQTAGRDRQGNCRRNKAGKRIDRACQSPGQGEEHGHCSVCNGIAPDAVNSPAVAAVGYDKTDQRHQDGSQHGHFLKIHSHLDIFFLQRFQAFDVKMDQVKCFDRLDIGKRFLIKSIHFGVHSGTLCIVVAHAAEQWF